MAESAQIAINDALAELRATQKNLVSLAPTSIGRVSLYLPSLLNAVPFGGDSLNRQF